MYLPVTFLLILSANHLVQARIDTPDSNDRFDLIDRVKRGLLVRIHWCQWGSWSKCSVTCDGKGIAARNRTCACKSTNVIKNLVKNVFEGSDMCDDKKPENEISKRACQAYNLCPRSSNSFPQIYWIIGGGLFGLILVCLCVWACVSAIVRKKKRLRFASSTNRSQPSAPPPITRFEEESPIPGNDFAEPSAPASSYPMTDLPPSYDEIAAERPFRRLSRSSTRRSEAPPKYSDVVSNSLIQST